MPDSEILLWPEDARLLYVLAHGAGAGMRHPFLQAVAAARAAPNLPLLAGGKSFGGRMTSTAQAEAPLPGVVGLVFLGFPLHAPKQPSDKRAVHLGDVKIPMLFLQGTRDDLADLTLMKPLCKRLGPRATLHLVEGADHSFRDLKRSGRTDAEVLSELAGTIAEWSAASTLLGGGYGQGRPTHQAR